MPRYVLPVFLVLSCASPDPEAAPLVDDTVPSEDSPVDSEPVVVDDTEVEADDSPEDTDAEVLPPAPSGPATPESCFGPQWGANPPVDYSWQGAVMGSHCKGTNHQDITDVERVVFIGDSITVGTLPTLTPLWYRNQLSNDFVARWGLSAPSFLWRNADPFDGTTFEMFSGDFASCAKYGSRTDDLLLDPHRQLETCIPEAERDKRTLIVMTVGGNDIFSLLEDAGAGASEDELRATFTRATDLLREAVEWVVEPGRFPNGVFLVFGNLFDFTDPDSAEEMAACPGAQLIGMDTALRNPAVHTVLAEAQETYLQIAAETGTDLFFLGEAFCGHGNNASDPNSRCYRGPGAALWYDLTCEHPNAAGHAALVELVTAVIDE
jgi:hypothetical protein